MNRRRFCKRLGALSAVSALAGCSLRGNRSIKVEVFNNRPTVEECSVKLKKEGEIIFSQNLDIPPENGQSRESTAFQTGLSKGVELTSVVENKGQTVTNPFELTCGEDFNGDLLTVKLQEEDIFVTNTGTGESCY